MKLNLKRIAELEKEYDGNNISLNTLQQMVDQVMYPQKDMGGWNNTSVYFLALSTLKDLGIIDGPEPEDKKPLNS